MLDSRRTASLEDPSIIEFGPFSLDQRECMLRRHGQPVPLTPKAVDVLLALVEQPGRLMTKEELVQRVWPDTFVEEANLAYNIFTIRKALGDTADNPSTLKRFRSAAIASRRQSAVSMRTGARLGARPGNSIRVRVRPRFCPFPTSRRTALMGRRF